MFPTVFRTRPPNRGSRRLAAAVVLGSVASGLLLGAATTQLGLGLLCFAALVPWLAALDRQPSSGLAGAAGALGGFVFFSFAFAWVPMAGYGGSLLLYLGCYVAVLAAGLGALSAGLAWLRRRDRGLFLIAAPVLWVGFEYLRSRGPLGYPWNLLGYGIADYPALIQLAALGGTFALSLWIASVNSALLWAPGARRGAALVVAAVLALPLGLSWRAFREPSPGETLSIAAIQSGIREPGRGSTEEFQRNLGVLLDLTEQAAAQGPDLVVWPESAFERPIRGGLDPLLGSIAHHYGKPLITGAWRVETSRGESALYNSAFVAYPDGSIAVVGDKVRPVVYYESKPVSALERWLAGLE